MIGEDGDRELVDWRKRDDDGTTVYELEYSEPVSEPRNRSRSTTFGAASGGTVPMSEQEIELPDGERISARNVTFEAEGTTLRVRCEKPSVLTRLRNYLFI